MVYFATKENVAWFLNQSGVDVNAMHLFTTIPWIMKSFGGGDFDYAATYFWGNLGTGGEYITSVQDADATSALIAFGDEAYNIMDAGNYLWGATAKVAGYSEQYTKWAAGMYTRVFEGNNDSFFDQRAISAGYRFAKSNFGLIGKSGPIRVKERKPDWISLDFITSRQQLLRRNR